MFIRAYLRASTADQDASGARASLEKFVADHDQKVASWYVEKGIYKGRPVDQDKHARIRELLEKDFSIRKTAEIAGAAPSTVQKVKRELASASA